MNNYKTEKVNIADFTNKEVIRMDDLQMIQMGQRIQEKKG